MLLLVGFVLLLNFNITGLFNNKFKIKYIKMYFKLNLEWYTKEKDSYISNNEKFAY